MADKTVEIDLGYTRIKKDVKNLNFGAVDIGIFRGAVSGGESIVAYATVNEFGTDRAGTLRNITIPPRPFIRSTVDENRREYDRFVDGLLARMVEGTTTARGVLDEIGIRVSGDIKKKITELRSPANEASTIRKKRSSNPLIDTGAMRNAVTFKVREF